MDYIRLSIDNMSEIMLLQTRYKLEIGEENPLTRICVASLRRSNRNKFCFLVVLMQRSWLLAVPYHRHIQPSIIAVAVYSRTFILFLNIDTKALQDT